MDKEVPFFDYGAVCKGHEEKLIAIFTDICSRGAFIMQGDLERFEEQLACYTGSKYAVGVANATDALELLFSTCDFGSQDEVIFCSHTMVATASAVKQSGAIPVPVEAGWDHLIDASSIREAITDNTRAIVPTQLNGRVADMDSLGRIADEFGLLIYEDSAQALGAKYKGRFAGTFGSGGCISFYPAKLLGCLGDGGAVLTNDRETYEKVKLLRDHGREEDGNVSVWGRNSRLDNLQAAFLAYFFQNFDETLDRRRSIARLYHSKLKGLETISLPPSPDDDSDHYDVYQNYEIEADERTELREYLANRGVGTLIQWGGKGVHELRDLGFSQDLPNTERMMRRNLMLPMNTFMTDEDVEYICDSVASFCKSR